MRRIAFFLSTALAIATCLLTLSLFALARSADAAPDQIGLNETCSDLGLKQDLLSWPAGNPRAVQTWVDVAVLDASFRPGTFARYGPFGPQSGVTLVGLPYQTGVIVRVSQVLPNGTTDVSPAFGFQTSWCGYKFGDIIAPSVEAANAIANRMR
jgi:hypothetical protein